jgi:hypothetical protein
MRRGLTAGTEFALERESEICGPEEITKPRSASKRILWRYLVITMAMAFCLNASAGLGRARVTALLRHFGN